MRSPTGALIADDCDKATLLNDYFGSVFTNDDGVVPPLERRVPRDIFLDTVNISEDIVLKHIKKCKPGIQQPDLMGFLIPS